MRFLITFIVPMAESFTFAYGGTPDGSGAATIHYTTCNRNSSPNYNYDSGVADVTLAAGWSLAYVHTYVFCAMLAAGANLLVPGQAATPYTGYVVSTNCTYPFSSINPSVPKMYSCTGGTSGGSSICLGSYGECRFTIFYV